MQTADRRLQTVDSSTKGKMQKNPGCRPVLDLDLDLLHLLHTKKKKMIKMIETGDGAVTKH